MGRSSKSGQGVGERGTWRRVTSVLEGRPLSCRVTKKNKERVRNLIMDRIWKKFDKLSGDCYSNMISSTPDKSVWDKAFDELIAVIESERKVNPDFAGELYQVDDETEFEHDVSGFLEDYMDELDMYKMYERLYEVCKTLLGMFHWVEDEPTDIRFILSKALKGQGKIGEAVAFCEKWHLEAVKNQSEEAGQVSAAALVYAQTDAGELAGAEKTVKEYLSDDAKCCEENEIIWRAAVRLYEAMGEKEKAKRMRKSMEKYEDEVDKMMEKEFADFGDLFGDDGDDWDFNDEWDDEDDEEFPFS